MAKKVSAATKEMQLLRKVADLLEPIAKASLAKGFQAFQGRVDLNEVVEIVKRRDWEALDRLIQWEKFPEDLRELSLITRKGIEAAAEEYKPFFKQAISKMLPNVPIGPFSFDPNSGLVSNVINRNVANLVVDVTTTTKMAIQEAVRVSLAEGLPPREAAKIIKRSIGLTPQQARAVTNLTTNLIDERFGKLTKFQRQALFANMDEDAISQKIERVGIETIVRDYAARQLDLRAENIARTETFRAVNMGQQQIWIQAMESGLIVREEVEKQWVVTRDGKICPVCLSLHEKTAPIDGVFGGVIGGFSSPPAHPRCRCHTVLLFKSITT